MTANAAANSGLMRKQGPFSGLEDKIRRRAYELYEARGCQDGNDLEDWLQAESEIVGSQRDAYAA